MASRLLPLRRRGQERVDSYLKHSEIDEAEERVELVGAHLLISTVAVVDPDRGSALGHRPTASQDRLIGTPACSEEQRLLVSERSSRCRVITAVLRRSPGDVLPHPGPRVEMLARTDTAALSAAMS
jgi:hypothetical protein